ncbi:hypothetical protein [Nonomuraea typhae]|uniref:hypothetical protein n=1 Tax=Nonomuraea typhae TaxID=2603600 RepID=UPI0012FAA46E|nr:hypothetical protein [Nonomuraea typhae]
MRAHTSLLLLEYEHLKEEQRLRISTRDNLVYTSLAAFALVIAGAIETGAPAMLTLLPPVCMILGWTYLVNDDRITAIGLHIKDAITPELVRQGHPAGGVFTWEHRHRADPRRARRKSVQLVVDLGLFCAPPLIAVAVAWSATPHSLAMMAVIAAETAGTLVLASHFLRNAVSGQA